MLSCAWRRRPDPQCGPTDALLLPQPPPGPSPLKDSGQPVYTARGHPSWAGSLPGGLLLRLPPPAPASFWGSISLCFCLCLSLSLSACLFLPVSVSPPAQPLPTVSAERAGPSSPYQAALAHVCAMKEAAWSLCPAKADGLAAALHVPHHLHTLGCQLCCLPTHPTPLRPPA